MTSLAGMHFSLGVEQNEIKTVVQIQNAGYLDHKKNSKGNQ
jgi:hypothetical protein